jgi:gluconokinase
MAEGLGIVFVIGPSGTGKSTIGSRIAKSAGGVFLEGDDHHPACNIQRMREGRPLDDSARWPWLSLLAESALAQDASTVVVACSALKASYRDLLRSRCPAARFVCLELHHAAARQRAEDRADHFMPAVLVADQYDVFERPDRDERGVVSVDASQDAEKVTADALQALSGGRAPVRSQSVAKA